MPGRRRTPEAPAPAPVRRGTAGRPPGGASRAAKTPEPVVTRSRLGRKKVKRAGPGRFKQLALAFGATRKRDPKMVWVVLAALLIPILIGVGLWLLFAPLFIVPLFVMIGVLAALSLFTRRAQTAAYAEVEGQPGVAASVVEQMRGTWLVTPAVRVNRQQDMVHRVVGRPGVVLLVEGSGRGARDLVTAETRLVRKVAPEAGVHEVRVGVGEDAIPLARLQMHLQKLPKTTPKNAVNSLDRRLKSLAGSATLGLPKGPLPKSVPRGNRR